jgi:hypothetical protein
MKSFILAIIALVVVAAGASVVLNGNFQKNADQAYATTGARVN